MESMTDVTAMVVMPATPMLIPGLVGDAGGELALLRTAIADALERALSTCPNPSQVLVLAEDLVSDGAIEQGAGPTTPATCWAGPVSTADFGVDLNLPGLDGGPDGEPARDLPTSIMALRGVLAASSPQVLAGADWSAIRPATRAGEDPPGDGGCRNPRDDGDTLLVVLADGAAGYGSHGPLAPDPAAAAFDERLRAAAESGEPETLRGIDDGSAPARHAATDATWASAAHLLGARTQWDAKLHYIDHPYGITYLVASWIPAR